MDSDLLIAGGGIAGLTAAATFGAAGFTVTLVDPAPADAAPDRRSTAFLQPARALLEEAGIWAHLAPHATPLRVMRIVDAGGAEPLARIVADFDSAEFGGEAAEPFGWNIPNALIREALLGRLAELPTVTLRQGTGFAGVTPRDAEALVRLSDSTRLATRLLIGADGRNSAVREAYGIGVHTFRYGQKALVFTVTHERPHDEVSTEIHRAGGPFTLVPLPDHEGRPASAVVWMERAEEALRLAALPDAAFSAAATTRSAGVLGELTLASPRQAWPIIAQRAEAIAEKRMALMAEAAHVVPPIGAQGLNMSLADLRALLELATPEGLGSAEMLSAYARRREPDIRTRLLGIDALNRAAIAGLPPLRDLRAAALRALHGATPVRRGLMQLGLGAR
ncbi:FAD-dependent monooxygenase [Pseudoroseicyclus tamaricis]|uniref:UbiH/UbiF family hydroxylase n=1 Tax=Pseudoroseicyclus tamaricis TaxID=2705421 RepID=A0A6B2JU07_9RHOB|nr:FAD-dependent monooxygenase [Pseudoroseicyclus tamaricis]NDV02027.1 UbiH/UbiF family hydroxylase [Pseudoroseicyclus tamaricis]